MVLSAISACSKPRTSRGQQPPSQSFKSTQTCCSAWAPLCQSSLQHRSFPSKTTDPAEKTAAESSTPEPTQVTDDEGQGTVTARRGLRRCPDPRAVWCPEPSFLKKTYLYSMHMSVLPERVSVWVSCMCLVLLWVRRRHWIPWDGKLQMAVNHHVGAET